MAQYGSSYRRPYIFKKPSRQISRENLSEHIKEILSTSDLSQTTPKTIRAELCNRLGLTDLSDRRAEINRIIGDLINTVPDHCRRAIKDYYNRYSRSLTAGIDTCELEDLLSNPYYSSLNISAFTSKSGLNLSLSDFSSAGSSSSNSESSNSITGSNSLRRNIDSHYRVFSREDIPAYCLPNESADSFVSERTTTNAKLPDSSVSRLQTTLKKKKSVVVAPKLPKSQAPKRTVIKKPIKLFESTSKIQYKKKHYKKTAHISATAVQGTVAATTLKTTITTTTKPPITGLNSISKTITKTTDSCQFPRPSVPSCRISTKLQASLFTDNNTGNTTTRPKIGVVIKACPVERPVTIAQQTVANSKSPSSIVVPSSVELSPKSNATATHPEIAADSAAAPTIFVDASTNIVVNVPKSPSTKHPQSSPGNNDANGDSNLYSELHQICKLSDGYTFDINNKPQLIFWKKVLRDTAYQYYNLSDESDTNNVIAVNQSNCLNDNLTSTKLTTTIVPIASPSHKSNSITKSPNKLQIIDLSSNYPADTSQSYQSSPQHHYSPSSNNIVPLTSQSQIVEKSDKNHLQNSHKSRSEPGPRCHCGQVEIASIRSLNSVDSSNGSVIETGSNCSARSSTIHSYNNNNNNSDNNCNDNINNYQDSGSSSSVPTVGHEITYQSESDMDQYSLGQNFDQTSEHRRLYPYNSDEDEGQGCSGSGSGNGRDDQQQESKQYHRYEQSNFRPSENNTCSQYSASEILRPMSDSSEVVYSVTSSPKRQHQQQLRNRDNRKRSVSVSGEEESDDSSEEEEDGERCVSEDIPPKKDGSNSENVMSNEDSDQEADNEDTYDNRRDTKVSPSSPSEEYLSQSSSDTGQEMLAQKYGIIYSDENFNIQRSTTVTRPLLSENQIENKNLTVANNNNNNKIKTDDHLIEHHNYNATQPNETNLAKTQDKELTLDEIIQNDQEFARRLQQEEYMAARPARRRMAIVACSRLHEQFSRSPVHNKMDGIDEELLILDDLNDTDDKRTKKRKYRKNSATKSRSCSPNKTNTEPPSNNDNNNTILKVKKVAKKVEKTERSSKSVNEEEDKKDKRKEEDKKDKRQVEDRKDKRQEEDRKDKRQEEDRKDKRQEEDRKDKRQEEDRKDKRQEEDRKDKRQEEDRKDKRQEESENEELRKQRKRERKLKRKQKKLKRKEKEKVKEKKKSKDEEPKDSKRSSDKQVGKKHRNSNDDNNRDNNNENSLRDKDLFIKKMKKISTSKRSRSESEDESNDQDEEEFERKRKIQRRKEKKAAKKESEERKERARNKEPELPEPDSSLTAHKYNQLQKLSPRMARFLGHKKLSINDISRKLLRYVYKKRLFFESDSRVYIRCDDNLSRLFGVTNSFKRSNIIKLIRKHIIDDDLFD